MTFSPQISKDRKSVPLPFSYFQEEDVVLLAQNLLGKILVTEIDGIETAGIIVETEAYRGLDDRASHAFQFRRTPRTETMFLEGGHAYIYLCYGLHHLFNVVVGPKEVPNAVLIRGLEPVLGIEKMMKRRKQNRFSSKISSGPACLSEALGIHKVMNGSMLWQKNKVWLEDWDLPLNQENILFTTRVGVDYAGEDALRPWRFFVKNNPFVSVYPKGL